MELQTFQMVFIFEGIVLLLLKECKLIYHMEKRILDILATNFLTPRMEDELSSDKILSILIVDPYFRDDDLTYVELINHFLFEDISLYTTFISITLNYVQVKLHVHLL